MDVRRSIRAWCAIAASLGAALPAAGATPVDVGGGILAGGYFGELRHDWEAGPGATLFVQFPWKCDLEGRLGASMVWNDGSMRERVGLADPDLGAEPGEAPEAYRRTSLAASLLWRLEPMALGEVAVPYIGAGFAFHERRVDFARAIDSGLDSHGPAYATRRTIAWDSGPQAIAGVRFYRTSGLFVSLEGTVHAIDTPEEWSFAYDAAFLLGYQIGP